MKPFAVPDSWDDIVYTLSNDDHELRAVVDGWGRVLVPAIEAWLFGEKLKAEGLLWKRILGGLVWLHNDRAQKEAAFARLKVGARRADVAAGAELTQLYARCSASEDRGWKDLRALRDVPCHANQV